MLILQLSKEARGSRWLEAWVWVKVPEEVSIEMRAWERFALGLRIITLTLISEGFSIPL